MVLALGLPLCRMQGEEAKATYNTKCAGCHGKDGKGDTKAGQKLGVRDFTDPKTLETLKDETLFKSIKEGLKKGEAVKMKPFADKLTDDEVKALVKLVRAFKK